MASGSLILYSAGGILLAFAFAAHVVHAVLLAVGRRRDDRQQGSGPVLLHLDGRVEHVQGPGLQQPIEQHAVGRDDGRCADEGREVAADEAADRHPSAERDHVDPHHAPAHRISHDALGECLDRGCEIVEEETTKGSADHTDRLPIP